MKDIKRDGANAVALGMCVGERLGPLDESERPHPWHNIGWDQIVTDVDRAAEALDAYQQTQPPDFWEEHDWYLTLDAITNAIFADPDTRWSLERIDGLVVPFDCAAGCASRVPAGECTCGRAARMAAAERQP